MKKIDLGQTITILANVGILIGIILLLVELNQSSTMVRGQTRNEISSELVGLMSQVANNSELANLVYRADQGQELTPEEMIQFNHRTISMIRYFENVHDQYRLGLYDEAEFETQREAWRNFYLSPATTAFWCGYRSTVSPSFREEIDGLISTDEC